VNCEFARRGVDKHVFDRSTQLNRRRSPDQIQTRRHELTGRPDSGDGANRPTKPNGIVMRDDRKVAAEARASTLMGP